MLFVKIASVLPAESLQILAERMENQIINKRYRIIQKIGTGGFGHTYLAEDLHLPTKPRVVVKHLKPQTNDEETTALASRLFQQEAEILYRLGCHPFIPQLLAHFPENGEYFLVQECIEGYTIAQEFEAGKRYNEKEIVQLLGQVLEILSFVHGQKVIHRDVKPANLIRRQSDGNIFLIDFGAVKQVNAFPSNQSSQTFSTVTIGSHGYMPMEQLAGKPNFSSDLYALGLVAIEALTGIKPTDLKQNQNNGEYVWTHKVALSPEIEHFICKLTRFDFRQRFHSASDALASLNMQANKIGFFTNKKQMPIQPINSSQMAASAAFPLNSTSTQSRAPHLNTVNDSFIERNNNENIPPTIIVPCRAEIGFAGQQITLQPIPTIQQDRIFANNHRQSNFSGKLSDYKYGIIFFVCLFFLGGLVFSVNSFIKTYQPELVSENNSLKKDEREEKKAVKSERAVREKVSSNTCGSSYSLFEEAEKQAAEAQKLEARATTKFDWEEIGNKYKRASALLASIDTASPDYSKAREKIDHYRQKAESAFEKISTARETPTLSSGSTNNY